MLVKDVRKLMLTARRERKEMKWHAWADLNCIMNDTNMVINSWTSTGHRTID